MISLAKEGTDFRIYCHRKAKEHFKSIPRHSADQCVPDCIFLHSAKNYREVEPFAVLVKVGPLRSKGWGSAPDALITAPRFKRLIHCVWSACADEDDFGYDPTLVSGGTAPSSSGGNSRVVFLRPTSTRWTKTLSAIGDGVGEMEEDIDDLRVFRELSKSGDLRKAVCVQIDEDRGILVAPESRVPSYDPATSDQEAVDFRSPSETLDEGMFIITSDLDEPNGVGRKAAEGRYSKIWKAHLRKELSRDSRALLRRLRAGGIELRHLRYDVMRWCQPTSTVIHSPKIEDHFRILINVLDFDTGNQAERGKHHEWWVYAWREIRESRGEAIQIGMQEHEILNQHLVHALRGQLGLIRERSRNADAFLIDLAAEQLPEGVAQFHKVLGIDEGFLAPSIALRMTCKLDDIEQWRV
jgi:hypothetical protein